MEEIINSKYYEGYEGEGEMQFIRHLRMVISGRDIL